MSAIRTILVHVDVSASSEARLLLAHDLASNVDADMTVLFGVAVADRAEWHYAAGSDSSAREADERIELHERHQQALRARLGHDGPEVTWGLVPPGFLVDGFVREAAFADLVVLGEPERDLELAGLPSRSFLEAVVLRGGRPTLVIPAAVRRERIGAKVLIAWDGSAQAARAMTAALPLLRRARAVHLLGFAPALGVASFSRVGIDQFLRRHGIEATVRFKTAPADVGRAICAEAAELDADLVVMGCYDHSRTRERLFGGATAHMLVSMPAPLLFAH